MYFVSPGDEVTSHTDIIWAALMTWNNPDNVLRVKIEKDKQPINFLHVPFQVEPQIQSISLYTSCNIIQAYY